MGIECPKCKERHYFIIFKKPRFKKIRGSHFWVSGGYSCTKCDAKLKMEINWLGSVIFIIVMGSLLGTIKRMILSPASFEFLRGALSGLVIAWIYLIISNHKRWYRLFYKIKLYDDFRT